MNLIKFFGAWRQKLNQMHYTSPSPLESQFTGRGMGYLAHLLNKFLIAAILASAGEIFVR